jgi:hypothetical protein
MIREFWIDYFKAGGYADQGGDPFDLVNTPEWQGLRAEVMNDLEGVIHTDLNYTDKPVVIERIKAQYAKIKAKYRIAAKPDIMTYKDDEGVVKPQYNPDPKGEEFESNPAYDKFYRPAIIAERDLVAGPGSVDFYIDKGVSMLGDNQDRADRVMDKLLSEFGPDLDDSDWEKVEEEVEQAAGQYRASCRTAAVDDKIRSKRADRGDDLREWSKFITWLQDNSATFPSTLSRLEEMDTYNEANEAGLMRQRLKDLWDKQRFGKMLVGKTYGSSNTPEFWTKQVVAELDAYFNNYGSEKGFDKILAEISNLDRTEETDEIARLVYARYARDLQNGRNVSTYEQAVVAGRSSRVSCLAERDLPKRAATKLTVEETKKFLAGRGYTPGAIRRYMKSLASLGKDKYTVDEIDQVIREFDSMLFGKKVAIDLTDVDVFRGLYKKHQMKGLNAQQIQDEMTALGYPYDLIDNWRGTNYSDVWLEDLLKGDTG